MKNKLLLYLMLFGFFNLATAASIDLKKASLSLEGNTTTVAYASKLFSELHLKSDPIDAHVIAKKINELSFYAPTTPTTSGTAATFSGTNLFLEPSAVALSATQFVIAYRSSASGVPGEAVVGTLSGNTISFGSTTQFSSTINATHTAISKISSTQFIVAFEDDRGANDVGEMRIGTVSGSSISFGSSFDFATGDTDALEMIALSSTSHVIVYRDVEDSNKGKARVVTVSGGTLSFGAVSEFLGDATVWTGLDALSSNAFVVAYQATTSGFEGGAIIGSVSGTTITFGSANIFETNCVQVDVMAISSDKFVVAYDDDDDGNGYVQVGTVSGTTITAYGTRQLIINTVNGVRLAPSTTDKFVVMYTPTNLTDPTYAREGEVTGTNITLSAQATIHGGNSDSLAMEIIEIDDGKHIYIYQDESDGSVGKAIYGEASGPANSVPTTTAPSAPTVLENAANVPLADNIQVSDADGDDQTVTFTVTGGTVTIGTTGITFGGSGNGSASFTAQGTLANINAALDAATFTPTPNLNGANAGTIAFTANDSIDDSNTASVTFNITAVDATVTSVSSSTANGAYNTGDVVSITVTFSEAVTVTGTPQITLETGVTDRTVNYTSGSGTTTLTFNYTVQVGDTSADLDYVGTTSLVLNSGTISDIAGNNAILTLPTPGAAGSLGANKAIVIDGIVPTVTSVSSSTANGAYNTGDVVSITVTFSEAVTVTGTPQITLETGVTDRTVNYASGSGTTTLAFNYTVQVGDTSADLDYVATNSLTLNGGTISDAASNNATLTLATPGAAGSLGANKAIIIDSTAPTVTNVSSSTANGTYGVSDVVGITVTFSEAVTVIGTPQITLETGATDRTVNYVSGSGTTTLTFNYTVQVGDTSADLDYVGTTSLVLNGGIILDIAGNNATLTLATPGAAGSLGANKAIVIDGILPSVVITSTESPGPTGSNPIPVTITFSKSVTGFDVGDITVGNGNAGNFAGSGTTYTADITHSGAAPLTITVDVGADAAMDTAGNGNTAATQFSITYDNVLGVNEELLANGLTIYPIPSNNSINISGETSLGLQQAEIFDIQGKLIMSKKLDASKNTHTITIASMHAGIYFMTIHSENSSITKRIIKQ